MSYIEFRNVKKVYKTGSVDVTALDGADFYIEKGELCVIVGQSGAGKTTLLNILGGMDKLSSGQVFSTAKRYQDLTVTNWRSSEDMMSDSFFSSITLFRILRHMRTSRWLRSS